MVKTLLNYKPKVKRHFNFIVYAYFIKVSVEYIFLTNILNIKSSLIAVVVIS